MAPPQKFIVAPGAIFNGNAVIYILEMEFVES